MAGAPSTNIKAGAVDRNTALDFTKGLLVLAMVLYHWLNYFVSIEGFFYVYVRFVTPAFIFLAGFFVSNVYRAKYGTIGWPLAGRLLERGLKLCLVFTGLNLLVNAVMNQNYNGEALGIRCFLKNIGAIYIRGTGEYAAFEILLPISYLLMFSPILLLAEKLWKYTALCISLGMLGLAFLVRQMGVSSYNLELLSVGALGFWVGFVSLEKIGVLARRRSLITVVYGIHLGLITLVGLPYTLHLVGVFLNLLLFYSLGMRFSQSGGIARNINLLGRYSLLTYIAQIGVLQVLRRALHGVEAGALKSMVSFLAVFGLTWGAAALVDWVRGESRVADRLYKAVFA